MESHVSELGLYETIKVNERYSLKEGISKLESTRRNKHRLDEQQEQ